MTSRVWRHSHVTYRSRHQSTRRRYFPIGSLLDTNPYSLSFRDI